MGIKKRWVKFFSLIVILSGLFCRIMFAKGKEAMKLPAAQTTGKLSVEEAIGRRRSVREYRREALSLKEVSQLLWAAQGISANWGGRTAPSAGALFPLEIYLVAGKVEGLAAGVYRYNPRMHALEKTVAGDKRFVLYTSSLFQSSIKDAPVSLVICAQYDRMMPKYGQRGERYVHMEAGHVSQNVYLQAEALGLATVAIGAFIDVAVKKVLDIKEEPLYIMPAGKRI
ncbi:MAG: SagB/ThcOx family dehydrogenase [Candidatus Omnitrophota bacterium]